MTPLVTTHLIEKERVELATDYLVHEFCKLFPSLDRDSIRDSITGLAPNRDSDEGQIKDFWNLFSAICYCWKLKDLTSIVTDANVKWEKKSMSIEMLCCETRLGWAQSFPPFPVKDSIEYLKQNSSILHEAIEKSNQIGGSRDDSDLDDPLIGVFGDNDNILVNDGNRRVLTRIEQLACEESPNLKNALMQIWVGRRQGEPDGAWVPTILQIRR